MKGAFKSGNTATMACMLACRLVLPASLAFALAFSLAGCAASPAGQGSATSASSASNAAAPAALVEDVAVIKDEDFGGVYLDMTIDEFNEAGFAFGDSVNVRFSNGYELIDIPYFNGYYVLIGNPLVVGYPGYPHVMINLNYSALWDVSGVAEGDTVTVELAEAGAFAIVQDALGMAYTNERADYATDEVFANFRALTGGRLAEGAVYRSASPIDNEYGRAAYVEPLMAQAGVAYVLNLSDSPEKADGYLAQDAAQGVDVSYFDALRDAGCVGFLGLKANFTSPEFAEKLAAGLVEMTEHDGPYLVHCVEGKDRTGFVCILLEALAGATYDEMQADYMLTYDNYYGISLVSDPVRYEAVSDLKFDEMMAFLAGADEDANLRSFDYEQCARNYLADGGMTEQQIDALIERLCA